MAIRLRVGGVPEHFNAPWHLAKQKGAFLAAGIELEYVDYPGSKRLLLRLWHRSWGKRAYSAV